VNFEETPFGTKIVGLPEALNAVANDSIKVELLESRVRELEAHIETLVTDKDAIATEFNDARWKIKELEAERDRLKGELEYQKTIEEQMDVINEGLRARHAALVEAVKVLTDLWEDNDSEIPLVINEIMDDIIKELAEVK